MDDGRPKTVLVGAEFNGNVILAPSLWNERNSRPFEDKCASFNSFWMVVQHTTSWWCMNYTKFFCNYGLFMNFNN